MRALVCERKKTIYGKMKKEKNPRKIGSFAFSLSRCSAFRCVSVCVCVCDKMQTAYTTWHRQTYNCHLVGFLVKCTSLTRSCSRDNTHMCAIPLTIIIYSSFESKKKKNDSEISRCREKCKRKTYASSLHLFSSTYGPLSRQCNIGRVSEMVAGPTRKFR